MGYEGPDLASLFDEEASVRDLCHDLADIGGSLMTKRVRELTPVGHQPFNAGYIPGHLRESIRQKIVVVTFTATGLVYESGSETNVDYGPYVEEGTGLWGPRRAKYEIRPKNPNGWLRFVDQKTGRVVFAKRVMHPGSPGAHMFARGVELTAAEFEKVAQPRIDEWARGVDARMTATSLRTRVTNR